MMIDNTARMPVVWLIGAADSACFAPATEWLRSVALVATFSTVYEAIGELSAQRRAAPNDASVSAVHAIVLLANRPGELSRPQIETLHGLEPLASLTALLGTWCEGEIRSGRVWPGLKRIYWHQWQGELPRALGWSDTAGFSSRLPRTMSEAERLEAALLSRRKEASGEQPLISVCCRGAMTFDYLADALRAGGYRAAWQRPDAAQQAVDANAWLLDGWPEQTWKDTPSTGSGRRILLLDFPRAEDVAAANEQGIGHVLGKPFTLPQLWATVAAALGERASCSQQTSAA